MTLVTSPKLRSVLVFVALAIAASAQMTFYTHGQKTSERTAFIGVVDGIEGSDKDYYIRFWSGDKLYSGKIGYDRLPILLNRKIAGFLEANDLLANQKLKVCLANTVYEPVGMVNTENGVRKVTPIVNGDIVNLEFVSGPTDTVNNACRARVRSVESTRSTSNSSVKPRGSSNSSNSNSSVANKPRGTNANANTAPKTLKQEASEQAQNFVDRYVNQCNGSYVFGRNVVLECKYFSGLVVNGREVNEWRMLTEAERLNGVKQEPGIEWDGKAELSFSVCRMCSRDSFVSSAPGWGQWTDSRQVFFLYLRKVAGEWTLSEGIYAPRFGDRTFKTKYGNEKKMFDNKTDFFLTNCPNR